MSTFTFSSEEQAKSRVQKANKVIAKLDLSPISIVSITPRKVVDPDTKDAYIVFDAELEIPTELVQIQGQEIVARIESIEGVNMVTRISGSDVGLQPYFEAPITCDHCGLVRNRKASWVVNSAERGLIQVGDSCADLYFGIDVLRVLQASAHVAHILDEDEFEGGSRRQNRFNFDCFTSVVVWHSMTKGFVTKKQAGEYGVSTSGEAEFLATARPGLSLASQKHFDQQHEELATWRSDRFRDVHLYEQALDWWLTRDDQQLSEFEHNCKVAILSQDLRFLGLSAYGLKIWADDQFGLSAKDQPNTVSKHQGEIGKRQVFNGLRVTNLRQRDTAYGTTTILSFVDAAQNEFVWFASSDPGMTLGDTYNVKATVKSHGEYQGVKQTTLTRVAIIGA